MSGLQVRKDALPLPLFDASALCPKCVGVDVGAQYRGPCKDPSCWQCDVEHIRRHCRTCHYEWAEACLDT